MVDGCMLGRLAFLRARRAHYRAIRAATRAATPSAALWVRMRVVGCVVSFGWFEARSRPLMWCVCCVVSDAEEMKDEIIAEAKAAEGLNDGLGASIESDDDEDDLEEAFDEEEVA